MASNNNVGWIKLNRALLDWEWYDVLPVRSLFLHLLLTVNYKDKPWKGILIKKGQRVTGRIQLAKESKLTEQQVRTAIKKLKSTKELTTKKTPVGTVFTIVNWDKYQEDNQDINQTVTTHQPESNQTSTTTKEDNNINNIITLYVEREFLNDWNELRSKFLNIASSRNRIGHHTSVANFKELTAKYSKEEFRQAMEGLFRQQVVPNGNQVMLSDPKHLLENFDRYLTACQEKNSQLYGKKQTTQTL